MFRISWVVIPLLAGLAPVHHGDDPPGPTLRCQRTARPPLIDGILDETCWREADVATHFVLLQELGPATEQTECMVTYDAKNLYMAFRCFESDPGGIRVGCTLRDGEVWLDDCVEVFLDPWHSHHTYFHLITNRIATRFDEVGPLYPRPRSWSADWQVGTRATPSGWNVEIALPFESLGLKMPAPGTQWGFNAHRQEYRLVERSSWSATLEGFHEPKNFGHLFFVPPL